MLPLCRTTRREVADRAARRVARRGADPGGLPRRERAWSRPRERHRGLRPCERVVRVPLGRTRGREAPDPGELPRRPRPMWESPGVLKRRVPRVLVTGFLLAVAMAGLSGCRTSPNVAAYVGD